MNDERLVWLTLNIEAPLNDWAKKHPTFSDKDAILTLEYAKGRIEKGRPLVLLDKDKGHVKNEAGESILLNLNQCRYQRKIILPQNMETYTAEEKIKCLDNTILAVKHVARGRLDDRTYLGELGLRLARLQESSGSARIITPT